MVNPLEGGTRIFTTIKRFINRHRLLFLLLSSIAMVLAMTLLARLPKSSKGMEGITVKERNGVYDLSDIADLDKTIVYLGPSSTYYPNTYLTPEYADRTPPESVEQYGQTRVDYLSQRFVILLPEDNHTYHLNFQLSGRHGIRIYANGRLTAQAGRLGTTKEETEVWENNLSFYTSAQNGKMDILVNSAQFYHAKRGATLGSIRLSGDETLSDPFLAGRIKGSIFIGALLCAAVLLLGVYFMLSPTPATLYFALACIVMALRECLQSQAWIYFPISGNVSFMLEYLSVVLLTILLTMYLTQYASGKFLLVIQYTVILGSCVYGGCILFADSILYTSVLGYYQFLLVACIVPGITALFWKMRRPTMDQSAAMFGIAVFYLAALFDIAMYSDVFGDGKNIPISEAAMLVFVLAQTVSLLLMNNRVLGEIREAERKLELEKIALEHLNQLKTEFLGNITHELKTPLTVMSGYAQTTKQLVLRLDTPEIEEVSRRMTLISSEAERLSLMVGQILEVTRMEEGRMKMNLISSHLDEIVHAAVTTHYPILNKNQNRLNIQIESGLAKVYADPVRVAQVIVNLISNSVRFTSEGVITISAKRQDAQVLVCVSDTGIGIAADRIPYLFERYYKKEKHGGGQDTGTGLGLYICKHIIEQHGGIIWIESEEGKGTSVFFTLPMAVTRVVL